MGKMIVNFFGWLFSRDDSASLRAAKLVSAGAILFALLAVVVRLAGPQENLPRRSRPTTKSSPSEAATPTTLPLVRTSDPSRPASPASLGNALNDAALSNLVSNYVAAAARNDQPTQQAMLIGLRRHPARAREILEDRRRAADSGLAWAFDQALAHLK